MNLERFIEENKELASKIYPTSLGEHHWDNWEFIYINDKDELEMVVISKDFYFDDEPTWDINFVEDLDGEYDEEEIDKYILEAKKINLSSEIINQLYNFF